MRRGDLTEPKQCYFRSDQRVFNLNGSWYFSAREGEIGPFRTRQEAYSEVERYALERRELDEFQHSREVNKRVVAGSRRPLSMELLPMEEGSLVLDSES